MLKCALLFILQIEKTLKCNRTTLPCNGNTNWVQKDVFKINGHNVLKSQANIAPIALFPKQNHLEKNGLNVALKENKLKKKDKLHDHNFP